MSTKTGLILIGVLVAIFVVNTYVMLVNGSEFYPPLVIEDGTGGIIKGMVYVIPWQIERPYWDTLPALIWGGVLAWLLSPARKLARKKNQAEFLFGLGMSFACVVFVVMESGFQVYVDTSLAAAFAATGGACMGVAKESGGGIGSFGFGSIVVFSFIALFAQGIFPGLVLGVALLALFCVFWVLGRSGISIFRLFRPAKTA